MVLVLSGTEEGRELVKRLHNEGVGLLTTVATPYGKKMFEQIGLASLCLQSRLDAYGFSQLIVEKEINTVIDATHPYAIEVSRNAMEACNKTNIRYVRFERQQTEIPNLPLIHKVKTMEEAVDRSGMLGQTIFLTTGISGVAPFIVLKDKKDLYVRILPISEHIDVCINMGISPKNIIAMHGPFSEDLNRAMFRQYHINTVVTKESGAVGGVSEKIRAALHEEIDVIVIMRPRINVSEIYSSIDKVVHAVKETF
ncbi:MAG: precorrin-6A reductase [Candidatus Brocadiaceae bacterium]|nr:precorrin-6A reductase [Candidatus Brocadiaceae bacterium]